MTEPAWRRSIVLADAAATEALGRALSGHLRAGDSVGLYGELGAGKSALARAVIKMLAGMEEAVPSPTFTMAQQYQSPWGPIWHFDLYRLAGTAEMFELGFEDAIADGIVIVEWPQHAAAHMPPDMLHIHLQTEGEGRRADLSGPVAWGERLRDVV